LPSPLGFFVCPRELSPLEDFGDPAGVDPHTSCNVVLQSTIKPMKPDLDGILIS
jgi:hypothetical protein